MRACLRRNSCFLRFVCTIAWSLLAVSNARAQWETQSLLLNPGWNAIRLHVDASHDSIENLVGAASPITEVWLWRESPNSGHIVANPLLPVTGSDWVAWSKALGPANAFPLSANATYLVRNAAPTPYRWNLLGRPVPPTSPWTVNGLNFLGFSLRQDHSVSIDDLLLPAPDGQTFKIFRYPGGEGPDSPPRTELVNDRSGTLLSRGEAVWMLKDQPDSDNRYFGPFETVLPDHRGVIFSENVGAYSFRVRNALAVSNNMVVTLLGSEPAPDGSLIPLPPILLRTTLDHATLRYAFTNIGRDDSFSLSLAPKGSPGSEVEVVLGLDRAAISAPTGTIFAGILRLQDTTRGQLQIDLPVSARQGSDEGLWVGEASIDGVGNYLKSYARVTSKADFESQSASLEALNEVNRFVQFSSNPWSTNSATSSDPSSGTEAFDWTSLASSADGTHLVAATSDGRLYVSTDAAVTWSANGSVSGPATLASSSDGTHLVAAVRGAQIFTSTDSGTHWSAQPGAPVANWQAVASSADGQRLIAAEAQGDVFTSSSAGFQWVRHSPAPNSAWQAVASSADGQRLTAATRDGKIYASANAGTNWSRLIGAPDATWQALASSADGIRLVAVANPGAVHTSADAGISWQLRSGAPPNAAWIAVACSADGKAIVAAIQGGATHTSADAGKTWRSHPNNRNWATVASSTDGTRIIAADHDSHGELYILTGALITPTLSYDSSTNMVLSGGSKYLTTSFNQDLGAVRAPFNLRLILHHDTNGLTHLLRQVFVGPSRLTTNAIVALAETELHPKLLALAHRLTAVHLPIASPGKWSMEGEFGHLGALRTVVTENYDHAASNPFLHSYHPDHDNLDATFEKALAKGTESYDIERQITLSFTPPAADFVSRTTANSRLQGNYLESLVLRGGEQQNRTISTRGTFALHRISTIGSLK